VETLCSEPLNRFIVGITGDSHFMKRTRNDQEGKSHFATFRPATSPNTTPYNEDLL
jgi:hypothetical protein